jgi:hypothetical protein
LLCDGCGREALPHGAAPAQAQNLIANGDFSGGVEPWGAHAVGGASSAPPPEARLVNGALCTSVHGGQEVIVGWPVSGSSASFALVAGQRYELSLRAAVSGTLPVECVVKVGHQVAPYTAAFTTSLPLGQTLERFDVAFAPDHDDVQAGLAVECRAVAMLPREESPREESPSLAEVCIDDVSLSSSTRQSASHSAFAG